MADAIAKLRKLAEVATPGPWCEHPNGTSVWSGEHYDSSGATPQKHIANATSVDLIGVSNIELIAAMRNSLPLLLDLVEKADEMRKLNPYTLRIERRLAFPDRSAAEDYDTARAALAKLEIP